jgi:hypothetical protein
VDSIRHQRHREAALGIRRVALNIDTLPIGPAPDGRENPILFSTP